MSPVRKYPPKPMTSNTKTVSGASYGNGTYKASSNSVLISSDDWRGEPWKAFNHTREGGSWHSENMTNDEKTGYKGVVWIQLQLPNPIRLHKYSMRAREQVLNMYSTDFPNKFQIQGSNNGTKWTVVDTRDNVAKTVSTQFETKEFTVTRTNPYKYFRLNVENVGVNGVGRGTDNNGDWKESFASITELSFFGEEEKENKTIWNPLDSEFWSMSNMAMWVYIGVAAVLVLILVMVLVM